jgi:hypothetical protein
MYFQLVLWDLNRFSGSRSRTGFRLKIISGETEDIGFITTNKFPTSTTNRNFST